ncbi:MAG: hypothetical protein H6756_15555 [Candidatus Omnitrophica bacterium]|nr:hypothetical protein [Candidatus Omnitrophota bacterium]
MRPKLTIICMTTLLTLCLDAGPAPAKERTISGKFQGRRTEGTFQKKINRKPGEFKKKTTWQTERGEGRREAERNWNKENHSGNYRSATTTADGKTFSREGTVTRTAPGSYAQQGTLTGPRGKTSTVDRTSVRNDDGTRSVDTTYTGPGGKTLDSEKTISYQDGVRTVEGGYNTGTGKSGTFNSRSEVEDGRLRTSRELTNQDGKTWRQNTELYREDNTLIREVTNTRPNGESTSFEQSVTVEEIEVNP